MNIELRKISTDDAVLDRVHDLYIDAFPPEERRPWTDILQKLAASQAPNPSSQIKCSGAAPFTLLGVYQADGSFAGFLTLWQFADFAYVEHFAVDPALRGNGIGAKAISALLSGYCQGRPVVLEAEPAECGPMAVRRLGFYRRCGFTVRDDFSYIQPPYAPGLPPVRLHLLTANASPTLPLVPLASTLRHHVYKK